MTAFAEYPKRLYRSGAQVYVWGKIMADAVTVYDADEEAAALAAGWCARPGCFGEIYLTDEAGLLLEDPAGNFITEG